MTYKKFYWFSLTALILASFYPIYMGIVTLINYIQHGYIDVSDYQKYIIPYTPICIALILAAALMPVTFKLFKKYTLLISSILGTVVFFISESVLEQIRVVEVYNNYPLESWQYSICAAIPEVLETIGAPTFAQNNPEYKIHFYIIALVIILAVINVIYGFQRWSGIKFMTKSFR